MKKVLFVAVALGAAFVMSSCKSNESAYRAAYERAKAQETSQVQTTTPVAVVETPATTTPATSTTTVTTTTTSNNAAVVDADVRTIKGGFSVVKGATVRTYGVVVGSFSLQANAESLYANLTAQGMAPSVVKTNETINGITGWYRVVAASYDDKAQAVQTRDQLRSTYTGAWLLYNK
ncbi:MAG: SPOR domain-containing protein [Bacteroidaceae bacterium]|nr:SPOR domain-containing protein [Bacteroidaceae bacterium]